MTNDADILIVGGGLNGPTLALALAQAGLTTALIDARPAPTRSERGFDGRAYAMAAASIRLMTALDVWPQVADRAQPIRQVKASDGRAGQGASPFFLHFDADELEDGQMGAMLEDRFLYTALLDRVAATPGIAHHPGQTVTAQSVAPSVATVTLAGGQILSGRLIIGCDGRASGTATRAGIRRVGWLYGQTALVTAIDHDLPHHGIAHQFFMPEGPLAILPLPGNRSSLVWTETAARAAAIQALPDDAYLAAIRPRVGDFMGAIRLAGDRFTYPLSLSLAEQWIAPRMALAGDAAHGVHPIAGQGLNLGLRDVAALAETLTDAHRRGEDIGATPVLARYQHWRRFDTTALALGADAVNRLFSNDNPILRPLRDIGMGLVAATPALRRAFMRQAAGLAGHRPRLLCGQPL